MDQGGSTCRSMTRVIYSGCRTVHTSETGAEINGRRRSDTPTATSRTSTWQRSAQRLNVAPSPPGRRRACRDVESNGRPADQGKQAAQAPAGKTRDCRSVSGGLDCRARIEESAAPSSESCFRRDADPQAPQRQWHEWQRCGDGRPSSGHPQRAVGDQEHARNALQPPSRADV